MTNEALTAPKLARKAEAGALAQLFCTGEKEMCLKSDTCSPENRARLTEVIEEKCSSRRLWSIRVGAHHIGMIVLGSRITGEGFDITEISYVVVDPNFRGKGVGTTLVRHIQSQHKIASLRAEARNPCSIRMLTRCGFQPDGEKSPCGDHPFLVWHGENLNP